MNIDSVVDTTSLSNAALITPFRATTSPSTFVANWRRDENGLDADGQRWWCTGDDGTRFPLIMRTWLKHPNKAKRLNYARQQKSEWKGKQESAPPLLAPPPTHAVSAGGGEAASSVVSSVAARAADGTAAGAAIDANAVASEADDSAAPPLTAAAAATANAAHVTAPPSPPQINSAAGAGGSGAGASASDANGSASASQLAVANADATVPSTPLPSAPPTLPPPMTISWLCPQPVGNHFIPGDDSTDFTKIAKREPWDRRLVVFNDNFADRSSPDGGGNNAAVRPWFFKTPRRAVGVSTGWSSLEGGFTTVAEGSDERVCIDLALDKVYLVAQEVQATGILFSCTAPGSLLDVSIFAETIDPSVVTYISEGLVTLRDRAQHLQFRTVDEVIAAENALESRRKGAGSSALPLAVAAGGTSAGDSTLHVAPRSASQSSVAQSSALSHSIPPSTPAPQQVKKGNRTLSISFVHRLDASLFESDGTLRPPPDDALWIRLTSVERWPRYLQFSDGRIHSMPSMIDEENGFLLGNAPMLLEPQCAKMTNLGVHYVNGLVANNASITRVVLIYEIDAGPEVNYAILQGLVGTLSSPWPPMPYEQWIDHLKAVRSEGAMFVSGWRGFGWGDWNRRQDRIDESKIFKPPGNPWNMKTLRCELDMASGDLGEPMDVDAEATDGGTVETPAQIPHGVDMGLNENMAPSPTASGAELSAMDAQAVALDEISAPQLTVQLSPINADILGPLREALPSFIERHGYALAEGSCFEVLPLLPAHSVDMICVDPPYDPTFDPSKGYQNKKFSDAEWITLLQEGTRVLKAGGKQFIFCNNILRKQIETVVRTKFPSLNEDEPYVWKHLGYSTVDDRAKASEREQSDLEYVLIIYPRGKQKTKYIPSTESNTRDLGGFPRPRKRVGEKQVKHVDLYRKILRRYERGVVLDYCMCTGVCGQVALELGHKFIGVEIMHELFESSKSRLALLSPAQDDPSHQVGIRVTQSVIGSGSVAMEEDPPSGEWFDNCLRTSLDKVTPVPQLEYPPFWDAEAPPAHPDLSPKLFVASAPEVTFARERLQDSLGRNVVVKNVWRIQHQDAWERFHVERYKKGGEKWVWHSSSYTDPLVLVEDDKPFSSKYADNGSYGRGLYFAEHAIYCDQIVPCRRSELKPYASGRPSVGDDIIGGKDDPVVWNVTAVGAVGDANMCSLRRMRWRASDAFKPREHDERLGSGSQGTTRWQPADVKFVFLARVALGKTKPFGNKCKVGMREAPGFDSWSGTEADLQIDNLTERVKFEEYRVDCANLLANGSKYGMQYVVDSDGAAQTYPAYLVEYINKRTDGGSGAGSGGA